jgi:uncharacterized protein YukE
MDEKPMSKWMKILKKISEESHSQEEPLTVETFLQQTDPQHQPHPLETFPKQRQDVLTNKTWMGMIIVLVLTNMFTATISFLAFKEGDKQQLAIQKMSETLIEQKYLISAMQSMFTRLESKQSHLSMLEGRIDNVSQALEDINVNFETMRAQVNTYHQEQENLNITITELMNRHDVLEKTIQELKQSQPALPAQTLSVPREQ